MFFAKETSGSTFQGQGNHVLAFLESSAQAQTLLERYGMSAVQLQQGRLLLNQLQLIQQQVVDRQSQHKAATDAFHAAWEEIRPLYQLHILAARRCLGRNASHFISASPRSYLAWVTQAQTFYAAVLANPHFLGQMASLSILPDELQRAQQLLLAMMASKDLQTQSFSAKQELVQQSNRALFEAKQWFKALLRVAEVAFYGQPALLRAIHPLEFAKATQKDEDTQSTPADDTESDPTPAADAEVLDLGAGI